MDIEGITKDGEIVPLSRNLGLRGRVLQVGWELPSDLSEEDWRSAGALLGKIERSVSWWLGDWWAFGESRYGERKAIVTAEDWEGPDYMTCRWAASIATKFGRPNNPAEAHLPKRREGLSFQHHAEVAARPTNEANALLDWCEETIPTTGKPRPTRELRGEVFRRRGLQNYEPVEGCTVEDLDLLVNAAQRFGVIYADPPWEFKVYSGKGKARSADRHYETQGLDWIKSLPVEKLAADDCALFLWAVMPELPGALDVIRAWGFEYKTVAFTWIKQVSLENRDLFWGMGYWTRANAEVCLLATRGSPKRQAKDVHQVIMSPVGEHSRKPDEASVRIERLLNGPYLELFARRPMPGWTVWGNQINRNLFQQEIPEFAA